LTPDTLIIGIGNDFRHDDGVGLTVAQRIAEHDLPGVRVVSGIREPATLLDVWSGVKRAIVVDAAAGANSAPGRIRRWTPSDLETSVMVSSHSLGLAQAYALGEALVQIPDELVIFTVDVVDTNHGIGLTPAVAGAVPQLVDLIVAELGS
jgi:hydrogenase maturation protease